MKVSFTPIISIVIVIAATYLSRRLSFQAIRIFSSRATPNMTNFSHELEIASLAVQRASILTKRLSDSIAVTKKSGTVTKEDKSPVTVGDYAAQAIVNFAIKKNFPGDEIVGEEDSDGLRDNSSEAKALSERIKQIIDDVQEETKHLNDKIGSLTLLQSIYDSIDEGNSQGGSSGRFWALDPIDGTKGFLRGDQFAVCLALVENGQVVLGVIGCPNLPATIISNKNMSGEKGGLYSAIKGIGAYYTGLFSPVKPLNEQERLQMKQSTSPTELKVAEGVESGHSSHTEQSQVKKLLGFEEATVGDKTINLDSQVKYCVLAKGQADIYLRLPISDTYREKIWDHAAGNILISESGGQVGDIKGNALDFGQGRYLNSQGVIAANKAIFPKVISAVSQVLGNDK